MYEYFKVGPKFRENILHDFPRFLKFDALGQFFIHGFLILKNLVCELYMNLNPKEGLVPPSECLTLDSLEFE